MKRPLLFFLMILVGAPLPRAVAGDLTATGLRLVDSTAFIEQADGFRRDESSNSGARAKLLAFNQFDRDGLSAHGFAQTANLKPLEPEFMRSAPTRQMSTAGQVGLTVLGLAVLTGLAFGIYFLANIGRLSS